MQRYEDYANVSREDAPRYSAGQEIYVDIKNIKTNRLIKKGDDKWAGPYLVLKIYPRSCLLKLPKGIRIFLIFHNSLLKPKSNAKGLPG